MAWTTPRTWVTNELVDASMLNEQIRDNLAYLLAPNSFYITSTSSYSTTSTSYTNVNATLTSTKDSNGGHWLCGLSAYMTRADVVQCAIGYDGANEVGGWRSNSSGSAPNGMAVFTVLFPSLAAGSHTFQVRWRSPAGATLNMYGADNGGIAIPPIIFWGIEI